MMHMHVCHMDDSDVLQGHRGGAGSQTPCARRPPPPPRRRKLSHSCAGQRQTQAINKHRTKTIDAGQQHAWPVFRSNRSAAFTGPNKARRGVLRLGL